MKAWRVEDVTSYEGGCTVVFADTRELERWLSQMLTNEKDKKICDKYSAYDEDGHVRCHKCPLQKGSPKQWDFRCKANSHYDRHLRDWVYDNMSSHPVFNWDEEVME